MASCTLTDRGRAVAWEVADCFVEVDIERKYETRDQCRDLARREGVEPLASGLGRDVFVPDPDLVAGDRECVLKIPHRLVGCYENRREARYWSRTPPEVRRYLAPVYDSDLGWLLMARAETGDLTSGEILDLWNGLSDAGWAFEGANWEHNLGRVDGRAVVVDYGGGCIRTD